MIDTLRTDFGPARDFSGRTVLVLHAHPDDEAIFTGATIHRLAARGARVVLVTATNGELGETFVPLRAGETVAQRRALELDAAAAILGVARVVRLGYHDSGLGSLVDQAGAQPNALAAAAVTSAARRVAELALAERAEAIVHYDTRGIYGHPDHVAVHRIGRSAARLAGITAYESTVDREHLHLSDGSGHLVYAASQAAGPETLSALGRTTVEISLAIDADDVELDAKREAIAVHRSQVPAGALDTPGFASAYRLEWYVRDGARSLLDELENVHMFAS